MAWPGSGVPVAVSSVSQQSSFSDFLGGRGSCGVLPARGAENTKAVGVPPDAGTLFSMSGGTGCTGPYRFFSGISACAVDGETKFWVTAPPPPLLPQCIRFGLSGRHGSCDPRVRVRLPVSGFSGVGFANCEVPGCCEKTLSRECGVSCFVSLGSFGLQWAPVLCTAPPGAARAGVLSAVGGPEPSTTAAWFPGRSFQPTLITCAWLALGVRGLP